MKNKVKNTSILVIAIVILMTISYNILLINNYQNYSKNKNIIQGTVISIDNSLGLYNGQKYVVKYQDDFGNEHYVKSNGSYNINRKDIGKKMEIYVDKNNTNAHLAIDYSTNELYILLVVQIFIVIITSIYFISTTLFDKNKKIKGLSWR